MQHALRSVNDCQLYILESLVYVLTQVCAYEYILDRNSKSAFEKTNTITDIIIIPASYIGHVYAYLFRTDF